MRITNKSGLPESIVNAVKNDPYDNGGADISCTTLISPPQQRALKGKYENELEEDANDRIWALFGQTTHHILERCAGKDDMAEARLFANVGKYQISGQIDLLSADGTLTDFKTTSVWAVKAALQDGKKEWTEQLNVLAWLYRHEKRTPLVIKKLEVLAICRDWRNNEALRYADYPARSEIIPIDLWSDEKAQAFVEERIRLHFDTSPTPLCTNEERWHKDDTWAVKKGTNKSATKVEKSEEAAQKYIDNVKKDKDKHFIEFREGENTRCTQYCSVSGFCQQYQSELKAEKKEKANGLK